jgi:hypothetical protein
VTELQPIGGVLFREMLQCNWLAWLGEVLQVSRIKNVLYWKIKMGRRNNSVG